MPGAVIRSLYTKCVCCILSKGTPCRYICPEQCKSQMRSDHGIKCELHERASSPAGQVLNHCAKAEGADHSHNVTVKTVGRSHPSMKQQEGYHGGASQDRDPCAHLSQDDHILHSLPLNALIQAIVPRIPWLSSIMQSISPLTSLAPRSPAQFGTMAMTRRCMYQLLIT